MGLSLGALIAILASCACALVILILVVCLVIRYCTKRKPKFGEYEKIVPSKSGSLRSLEKQIIINSSLSMKTIPFTVPSTTTALCRRTEQQRTQDDASSNGGSSEPSSPSLPTARTSSTEATTSSGSIELRGAYALGSIDPSLYKINDEEDDYDIPDDHIGRIWFAVEYERESEKLLVTLIKAKNLPSRTHGTNNGCDPFVRICLTPDERRSLQSKCKKKTCNPKFEESFVFQVSNRALEERVLKLTVFDVDRHRRHNVVGHALYPLKEHNYESNERVVIWRDLEREIAETAGDKGEVNIALSYNDHLERLTVGVFEGRNFKKTDGFSTTDYYVKVSLLQQSKVVKTKKTEQVKRTTNPDFNESFTFKLPANVIDISSVTITAMQHATGQRDKAVGRIVLGSFMFARGKELEHWNDMVSNQREQTIHWHTLT